MKNLRKYHMNGGDENGVSAQVKNLLVLSGNYD